MELSDFANIDPKAGDARQCRPLWVSREAEDVLIEGAVGGQAGFAAIDAQRRVVDLNNLERHNVSPPPGPLLRPPFEISNSNWPDRCTDIIVRVGPRHGAAVLRRSGSASASSNR